MNGNGISPLGSFILWLNDRALSEGRVKNTTEQASDILIALRHGADLAGADEAARIGLELRDGRPHSEVARQIQRAALARLRDLTLLLINVDEQGYTPVNVRALLSIHYGELAYAALGTDANCAYIDLDVAIKQASDKSRIVAELLIQGKGPQEIGEELKTNGSRRINRALAEIAKILEGRYGGKETTGRRSSGTEAGVGADDDVR